MELDEVISCLVDLEPTHVELTYMLAQLSFQYAGQRFQGEILKATEKFQQILSDDLHEYYTNELEKPRYSDRVAKMMKCNNIIQVINELIFETFKTKICFRNTFEKSARVLTWPELSRFSVWNFRIPKCSMIQDFK